MFHHGTIPNNPPWQVRLGPQRAIFLLWKADGFERAHVSYHPHIIGHFLDRNQPSNRGEQKKEFGLKF